MHRNSLKKPTNFALHALIVAVCVNLAGPTTAEAKTDIPSGLPFSPLFGAEPFTQRMLRFEEFDVRPLPTTPEVDRAKTFPTPLGANPANCVSRPDTTAMDTFLDSPLWPDPTQAANISLTNAWADTIAPCLGRDPLIDPITGAIEGRPPGVSFSHQRWTEFFPTVAFQTAMGGARTSGGRLDDTQSHGYSLGEFGPGGLYHNTVGGGAAFDGTTAGIGIKFHPNMPLQDPKALWTFGDGTLPPKLLRARYGQPILLRHYNALPIDAGANNGFGEHTITTHEHNGHNPGESDGFAGAFFYPGQFYDYRWPMQLAGYDFINTNASDPRASTPCAVGETLMISNSLTGLPEAKPCDPVTQTVNIPGDWHETMSTHWFHDHMIDRTHENVYKGNAAMMNYYSGIDRGNEGFKCNYTDPANNINLCFPSGTALPWGNRDYDVQLLIAAKAWGPGPTGPGGTPVDFVDGQLKLNPLIQEGFLGDRMTVNWLFEPYLDVRARKYRFRILNGAVARFFKFALVREFNDATSGDMIGPDPDGLGPLLPTTSYSRIPFHMIANDGNIMEHAIPFPNAQSNDLPIQAIAERYDIIVDFSQFPVGTKIYMVNTLQHDDGRGPKAVIPLADILSGLYNPVVADPTCTQFCWDLDPTLRKFLEFRVQPYDELVWGPDTSMNPADYEPGKKRMIPVPQFTDAELAAATHRTFTFGTGGGVATDNRPIAWAISTDGGAKVSADVNRVSAAPETMGGGMEIWHIVNGGGGWAHPVHVHFEEGRYLSRTTSTGIKVQPPLWEKGARKDMYRVSSLGEDALGNPAGFPDSSMAIDVAIRFREFAGTFVEHCHNTTHEDKAMLLRWDNEVPGQTVRIPTPIPGWDGVDYVSVATPWQDAWRNKDTDPFTFSTAVQELPSIKTGDAAAQATYVAPKQLVGDFNWDENVTLMDYIILRSQYGSPGLWASDINQDRNVTLLDYILFRGDYGSSSGLVPAQINPLP